jgi:hypothetical protein
MAGLLLRSSQSLCRALLELLSQAVGFDQHILRISQLLLPHVAKSAKVGPVPLFALGEPPDQFEIDLGRFYSTMLTAGVIAADRALRSRKLCLNHSK